jgi:hypothetical protein
MRPDQTVRRALIFRASCTRAGVSQNVNKQSLSAARRITTPPPPYPRGLTALFGHLSFVHTGLDRKRSAGPVEIRFTSATTDMRMSCLTLPSNGASNLQSPCGGESTSS